ncbi:MAG: hypothetical protein LBE62_13055 [Azonexus sp.]|jgi:hypothetical protein|nr:hypothetical protein [Azonexus sp.]
MQTKPCYQLDADGCYVFTAIARAFPDDPENYNIPGDAVLAAPPETPAGSVARWTGSAWEIIADHRRDTLYRVAGGQTYSIGADVQGQHYNGLGPIPAWLSETPPELPAPAPVIPAAITPRQARLALLSAGLYEQVQTVFAAQSGATGEAARIEWEFATAIERANPLIAGLAAELGLTEADLDNLFITAQSL